MRIFLDSNAALTKIAGEMLNIEAGRYIYESGIENTDPKILSSEYPSFDVDGVRTSVKASYGVIYIPAVGAVKFLRKLAKEITRISRKYEETTGKYHLDGHSRIISGDQFTSFRMKNSEGTYYDHHETQVWLINSGVDYRCLAVPRIFMFGQTELTKRTLGFFTGRFAWYIYTIDQLLYNIENYNYTNIEPVTQLFSILYDKGGIFNFADGDKTPKQLTFKHAKSGGNFHDLLYFGEVTPAVMRKVERKSAKSVQTIQKTQKLTTAQNTELQKANIQKARDLSAIVGIYKSCCKKPESILSGYLVPESITLCPIRGGSFEIIRHFGKWHMFQHNVLHKIIIEPMRNNVYEADFRDIIIANSSELCSNCETPLYDDIYVIFPSEIAIEGNAICPTCIHTTFEKTPEIRQTNLYGELLYKETDIVVRTKYPRTASEVIETMNTDDRVKEILKLSFQGVYIVHAGFGSALYLGKKYIAWKGSLTNYVLEYSSCQEAKKFHAECAGADLFLANILI